MRDFFSYVSMVDYAQLFKNYLFIYLQITYPRLIHFWSILRKLIDFFMISLINLMNF
jgi:hypothetical protein